MKKTLKIIILLLVISTIIFLIIRFNNSSEKYFNTITLDSSIRVTNYTDKNYLDTIVSTGLSILNLEKINVVLLTLSPQIKDVMGPEEELQAHVREKEALTYYIWITDLPREKSIDVLSHELIHIEQYATNRLIFENNILLWELKEYDLNRYEYRNRPWEIEAFSKEKDLSIKIKEKLY